MSCNKCTSHRIVNISAKCSDLCSVNMGQDAEIDGYVPSDMNIGRGDYIEMDLCLECGHVQGEWPLPKTQLERISPKVTDYLKNWQPNPNYRNYVDALKDQVQTQGHLGILPILPTLMGKDDNADRIMTGIIELRRDEMTREYADMLINMLYEWEHYDKLNEILALLWPEEYGDDLD